MKLLLSALLLSSFVFSMQDPKNMSRKSLEEAYISSQQEIARQKQTVASLYASFDMIWNLHYGAPLERVQARADLKRLQLIAEFIIKK